LNALIEVHAAQVSELKEKNNLLSRHLNNYKKKGIDEQQDKKASLLPIDRAIVKVVKDLLGSHQQYKVASKKTLATRIA
jgi:hypothetical protein